MKSKPKYKIRKNHLVLLGLLLFVTAFTILFIYINPRELIELIGVKNGYLIIAFFSLFGGFSLFTSFSFYATVIAFTLGGLNPFLVALVSIPGLFAGDSIYYYFGNMLNTVLPPRMQKIIDRITAFIYRPHIYRYSPIFIYLYVGVTPLPPDVLIISLSMCKYPFRRLIIPLLLGEVTFVLTVSLLAREGIRIFGL